MNDSERYAVDEARIVSEIIDGEAVIVNLTNGYYYSLDRARGRDLGVAAGGAVDRRDRLDDPGSLRLLGR